MQKNDLLVLDIVDLGMEGEGIARAEGLVIFVPYALTGERVEAKILKVQKNFAFAKLVRVIQSSSHRVEPACGVFYKCGGCHLMHMDEGCQTRWKAGQVQNCLRKGGIDAVIEDVEKSPKLLGYRNKLQLPVGADEKGTKIGFFRGNSHDIVDIDICPVVGKHSQKLIEIVKKYIAESGDSAYDEASGEGNIRHVVVRTAGEQMLITLVTAKKNLKDKELLIGLLEEQFCDFGLYTNLNQKRSNVVLGEQFFHLFGRQFLEGEVLGIKYKITPSVFLQINDQIAAKIYAKVADMICASDVEGVIDAYSGISILSAVIAGRGKEVYAIEINPNSFAAAEELRRENGVKKLCNICGDTAQEMPKILEKFDQKKFAVILDPPRKGCDQSVLDAILAARPSMVIYISCNPATLARDLARLTPHYTITSATPYDMFPQTHHVETLVCLALKQGGEEGVCRQ